MSKYNFFIAVFIAIALYIGVSFAYLFFVGNPFDQTEAKSWGQLGDILGGVLNPIYALGALIAVLLTIVAQGEALGRQNFESSFFQMLNLHNSIVQDMDAADYDGNTIQGRDCIKKFLDEFERFYKSACYSIVREADPPKYLEDLTVDEEIECILISYKEFKKNRDADSSHYMRNLFCLIDFVDHSAYRKDEYYMRIIRAQLSISELVFIFYMVLGYQGKSQRLKKLIEKYGLFKNIQSDNLFNQKHASFYSDGAMINSKALST